MKGLVGALINIGVFFTVSATTYTYTSLINIEPITFYWMAFTILTGIWETGYIIRHSQTVASAEALIETGKRVWLSDYNLGMLLPFNFSVIFYAEYGAWADREYMTTKDRWSKLIEGTHAIFCGFFSLLAILFYLVNSNSVQNSTVSISVAMGSQLMNSVLYMGQYSIQTKDQMSVNFDCSDFPCGKLYIKRPFMWINIFWTVMPAYIILRLFFSGGF
jgi:hypothetical protein